MIKWLTLICCLFTAFVSAEDFEPFTGKVTASRVRMRIQPDLDSYIVKELEEGEMVAIIGEVHDFYIVSPPAGQKTYIYRKYVFDNVIAGEHVNVRLTPDMESPVLGQLNNGDHVVGSLVEPGSHWLPIEPPEGICFFVAKDFVRNVGGPELVQNRETRLSEVGHLMNQAYLVGQSELRKPFEEVDIAKVKEGFEKVINEYSDFPEFVEKAQTVLAMAHDLYLQKKIAFLESKTQKNSVEWAAKNAELNEQLEDYQKQIAYYQEQLEDATPKKEEVVAAVAEQVVQPTLIVENLEEYFVDREAMTDRMRVWEPTEEALYQQWSMENEDRPIEEFYAEAAFDADMIEGIVENYTRPVLNRPGDFLLRVDNRPVAFLYSTKVNLEDTVGHKVRVKAIERPNNHFAFPAYYVISVE